MRSALLLLVICTWVSVSGCNSSGGTKLDQEAKKKLFVPEMPAGRILKGADLADDLVFPTAVSPNDFTKKPQMAIYKPAGEGPFPALVLAHQCGGLRNSRTGWQNESMLDWARQSVERGYVVLLIDQLKQRGAHSRCRGMSKGLSWARAVKDILQAAEHLRSFDFVDSSRVGVAGYSFGAMVAVLSTSKRWSETLSEFGRIDAAVAFYPGCYTIRPSRGAPYDIVNMDIQTPLLVLMGADDTETLAVECTTRLKIARDSGAPVSWHVYPDTTHCWDCKNLNGISKTSFHGRHVNFYYNESATLDAASRMFGFFERTLEAD